MKAYIDPDVESYPDVSIVFAGEETSGYYRERMRDVPDDLAARWREARDQWRVAAAEIRKFVGWED